MTTRLTISLLIMLVLMSGTIASVISIYSPLSYVGASVEDDEPTDETDTDADVPDKAKHDTDKDGTSDDRDTDDDNDGVPDQQDDDDDNDNVPDKDDNDDDNDKVPDDQDIDDDNDNLPDDQDTDDDNDGIPDEDEIIPTPVPIDDNGTIPIDDNGTTPTVNPRGFVPVKTFVQCPTGFACPTPEAFTMKAEAPGATKVSPDTFEGSNAGIGIQVIISLRAGQTVNYRITEIGIPPTPTGLTLVQSPSAGCQGAITHSETKPCNFTNVYKSPEESKADVLVKQLVICPQGFVCPPPERFSNRVTVFGQVTVTPDGVIPGSEEGTKFVIDFGAGTTSVSYTYTIDQRRPAPLPDGLTLVTTRSGCEGTISPKDQKTCIFTNEYRVR